MINRLIIPILLSSLLFLSGCSLGFLLFYKEVQSEKVYRSSASRKNYYTVDAITLSHCGCTYLKAEQYVNRELRFRIFQNYAGKSGKTVYTVNSGTGLPDTLRYLATTADEVTMPFDSLDREIFSRFDSIAVQKPKGVIYSIPRMQFKGYKQVYYPLLY